MDRIDKFASSMALTVASIRIPWATITRRLSTPVLSNFAGGRGCFSCGILRGTGSNCGLDPVPCEQGKGAVCHAHHPEPKKAGHVERQIHGTRIPRRIRRVPLRLPGRRPLWLPCQSMRLLPNGRPGVLPGLPLQAAVPPTGTEWRSIFSSTSAKSCRWNACDGACGGPAGPGDGS